jgi:predicted nucleotidyltransferase component of viral defense system
MDGILIDGSYLRVLAGKYQVPVGTVEKDLAVTVILSVISKFQKLSQMTFKGGTALKKIYFPQTRFSEDLDFTCDSDISEDLKSMIDTEIKKKLDVNFTSIKPERTGNNSKKFYVKYNGFNGSPNSVRVDLSLREKVIRKPLYMPVLHIYELGNQFAIPTMNLEEIMAEKIRAIVYTPGQPRHLYDSWYLSVQNNVKIIPSLVESKISFYNESFSLNKFREGIFSMKSDWEKDLKLFLFDVPLFDTVSQAVIECVENAMK